MYYVPMTTEQTPAPATPADVTEAVVNRLQALSEVEEVTGYGYLTDAEREAAIRDHNAAVKAKGRK